ncbi:large ribosomal subunit protein bL33m isoform X1 [Vulpes vulpes]|uniref:Large ribosomal subunit protein bL33m n=1 Tax=Vulpes vulpes TaxID=9627 RepID=A0ABM5BAJ7_VULVU
MNSVTGGGGPEDLYGGRGLGQLPTSSSGTRCVPRKHLFVERLWARFGDRAGVVTMFLSAVTFAKSKSKTILVKMLSQAGTGYSFNTKRSRLREKLTLLHYDPIEENVLEQWTAWLSAHLLNTLQARMLMFALGPAPLPK